MSIAAIIKKNIKRNIKAQGKTVAEVCASLGVNRNYINHIGNGTRLDKIATIAHAININIADLFSETT